METWNRWLSFEECMFQTWEVWGNLKLCIFFFLGFFLGYLTSIGGKNKWSLSWDLPTCKISWEDWYICPCESYGYSGDRSESSLPCGGWRVHCLGPSGVATSNPKSPGDNWKSLHQTKKQENLHSHENRQASLPLVLTASKCCFRSQASCLSRPWTPPQLFSAYCRAGSFSSSRPQVRCSKGCPRMNPA